MKTEITMNKEDLIKLVQDNLTKITAHKAVIKSIDVTVVTKDDNKVDFKELSFILEM